MIARGWKAAAIIVAAMALWALLVVSAPLLGFGRLPIDSRDSAAFLRAAADASREHKGNLALVLIENGRPVGEHSRSIGRPVSGDSMFQMASVSKWVTAWGVMALVESGKIELDTPVSRYLKRWRLPAGDRSTDQVTVRRLLSHTAGLTDDLGYCGFAPGTAMQTLPASLTKAADACPFRTGEVRVGDAPGSWRYSGGGYTLLQLLIEDVSEEPFARFMAREVLDPLGMTRSSFRTDAAGLAGLAEAYSGTGARTPYLRFTASAAASLYASANDMARFALAHQRGINGEPIGRGVLTPEAIRLLLAPQASSFGYPHWGLGPQLYARSTRGGMIAGHDGGNMPAVNTTVRIEPGGDGIVVLSTGGQNIASYLGNEWTRVRRSGLTPGMALQSTVYRLFNPAVGRSVAIWVAAGWAAILALAWIGRRQRRARRASGRGM